jgi:putative heme-binding domain-containing protein
MKRSHQSTLVVALASTIALAGAMARIGAQEQHPGEYSPADVENGARLYGAQCITCHGPFGDGVGSVDLRRGVFKSIASDDDLRKVITTGVASAGMPKFDFNPNEQNGLVAFIRAGFDVTARAAKVGDPARGKVIYDSKGNCASCHRIAGSGPRKAPDLTDIGSLRSPSQLQQSVLDPSGFLLPINRPVRAVTKDGKTITGRRLNEDTYSLQIIDEAGKLMSLQKSDLKEYQVTASSPMPPYKDKLTADEIADVVAYLLSLKG